MISRKSSGSMDTDSAVEPTRSQNITVTCRRSAESARTSLLAVASLELVSADEIRLMAFMSLIRSPSGIPISRRWSSFRSLSIPKSSALSRNVASYFSKPRLRQPTTQVHGGALIPPRAFNGHDQCVIMREAALDEDLRPSLRCLQADGTAEPPLGNVSAQPSASAISRVRLLATPFWRPPVFGSPLGLGISKRF